MFGKIKIFFLKPVVRLLAIFIRDKEKRRLFRRNILLPEAIHLRGHSYIIKPFWGSTEKIGKYCSIASNVHLGLAQHPLHTISTHPIFYPRGFKCDSDVIVDNDVWIGCNALIMGGVHIHNGAVVAAGAVVTKDVPPYAIVAGVPARILRYRFDEKLIQEIEKIKWWDYPEELLKKLPYENPQEFLNTIKNIKE